MFVIFETTVLHVEFSFAVLRVTKALLQGMLQNVVKGRKTLQIPPKRFVLLVEGRTFWGEPERDM